VRVGFCVLAVAAVLGLGEVRGQDAAPQDRSAINSPVGTSRMAADSPVTFPASGPLPPRHVPDVPQPARPSEEGVFVFESLPLVPPPAGTPLAKYPGRSPAQVVAIQETLAPGDFTPPPHDWQHLPRTRRALASGGRLTIVALGDSIVNDTMRSGWIGGLRRAYPQTEIRGFVCVRGGGGCHFFGQDERIARYVVPLEPDLVIIGGISRGDRTLPDGSVQRAGIGPIRDVIRQLRAARPDVEILLMTGAFGSADPRNDEELAAASHSATSPEGRALRELAAEQQCGFLDMTTPWREYIRSSGLHPHAFYRDRVHANEHGEQILARILLAFFSGA
jgi:lysophospholipase L1-like esterase